MFDPSIIRSRAGRGTGREHIYVIHNGQLLPASKPVPRSLRGIALRVLASSGKAGMMGDLVRIYAFTREAQASFQWVTIPEAVDIDGDEVFDPVMMTTALRGRVPDRDRGPGVDDPSAGIRVRAGALARIIREHSSRTMRA